MNLDPSAYLIAAIAITILGLAKGGFAGAGVLAVPLMTLVMSPVRAAAIILPILLVQDVVGVWAFRHSFDKRMLKLMLPAATVGVAAGYGLAAWVSESAVEAAVGVIALLFGGQKLWLAWQHRATGVPHGPLPRDWFGLVCGAASGFTSMVAHAGGPPFQLYALQRRLSRDSFIGTSAIFFAALNWIKVPPYFLLGQFSRANLLAAAALLPFAIGSTMAGVWLIRRVSGEKFTLMIYALLVVVGAKLAWTGLAGL